jgi:glutamyl-tRNA reductase
MKVFKHFTIDEDLSEKLEKEKNASKIINSLIRDYYGSFDGLRKQELINKLLSIKMNVEKENNEIKNIEEQIKKIEEEENKIREVYKNIPKEVLDDFKFFNKMNLDSLFERYKEVYSKIYNTTWEEIKKAFIEFKGIKEENAQ